MSTFEILVIIMMIFMSAVGGYIGSAIDEQVKELKYLRRLRIKQISELGEHRKELSRIAGVLEALENHIENHGKT